MSYARRIAAHRPHPLTAEQERQLARTMERGAEELAVRHLTNNHLRESVDRLDARTATTVRRRFGLDGFAPATLSELGEEFGVSPEAIRRRVLRAVEQLRTDMGPMAPQVAAPSGRDRNTSGGR